MRKLPAYGKQLLADRRAGKHPMDITLVYGDEWYEGVAPRICLKPEDYEPRKYDFSICAGTHVLVLDQLVGAVEHDDRARPPTYGKFYDLLAELAAADCWVTIRWPKQLGWANRDLGDFAFAHQWWDLAVRKHVWPRWWNNSLDRKHSKRWSDWHLHRAYSHGHLKREHVTAA